jgi:hypothetical protein
MARAVSAAGGSQRCSAYEIVCDSNEEKKCFTYKDGLVCCLCKTSSGAWRVPPPAGKSQPEEITVSTPRRSKKMKHRIRRRRKASRTGMTQIITTADGGTALANCPARTRLENGQAGRIARELAFRQAIAKK